ncbi:serine/threonine protein kinase [Pseudonocardia sp. GCM10023141]|uniref:serine/threonine protein kinase n=1 Tax=Pseudonocardia sp. GCM10023141 TaxID=3252653 RepID=UPI003618019A
MGETHAEDRVTGLPAGYEIVRRLGGDTASTTLLAVHRDSATPWIGVLAPQLYAAPGARAAVRERTDAVAVLGHPGVVPLRVADDVAGPAGADGCYLLAPLPAGAEPVALAPGSSSLPVLLGVLAQVADILDALHRRGIVHGDLRLHDVLVDARTGQAHLAGLGLAPYRGAAPYPAPEVRNGFAAGPAADVHGIATLLVHCLTGRPPQPDADNGLPPALAPVMGRALVADPAQRGPGCRAIVDAAAAALGVGPAAASGRPVRRRHGSRGRWGRRRWGWTIGIALGMVVVLVAGLLGVPRLIAALGPTAADLARVPAAVRSGCSLAGSAGLPAGSSRQLSCRDGSGQELLVGLYGDAAAAESAYRSVVTATPGLRTGSGDCASTTGVEHLYPGVGAPVGRVLCTTDAGNARMVWLDRGARTVATASQPNGDTTTLYRTWAGWVGIPAYPTPAESALKAQLYETDCHRAPPGTLDGMDGLDGLVAALECAPLGKGASSVRYLRFSDAEHLGRGYRSQSVPTGAGPGVNCLDPKAPTFLGEEPWYLRGVSFGRLTCTPGTGNAPTVMWTGDPLLMLGIATGTDRTALVNWFLGYSSPDYHQMITAYDQRSQPVFPTSDESKVLAHVPTATRQDCLRPSPQQVTGNVGTATVIGVSCAPAKGADNVLYYGYADPATLTATLGAGGGADCTANPPGFSGTARYTRPGGATGVLNCGIASNGKYILDWSDERSQIRVVAYGTDPAELLAWWQTAGGPS